VKEDNEINRSPAADAVRDFSAGRYADTAGGRRRDDSADILTSREARELLKVGRTKLWELTRANAIPAYRVGHGRTSRLRYRRSELLEWLEQMRI
jgi:excisionase family DNA binding protein